MLHAAQRMHLLARHMDQLTGNQFPRAGIAVQRDPALDALQGYFACDSVRRHLVARQHGLVYLPSRSESPGTARSTVSLTRLHASRVAPLAFSQSRLDLPRALPQSRDKSLSTSSKLRPG